MNLNTYYQADIVFSQNLVGMSIWRDNDVIATVSKSEAEAGSLLNILKHGYAIAGLSVYDERSNRFTAGSLEQLHD
jgi:hypothetical protein